LFIFQIFTVLFKQKINTRQEIVDTTLLVHLFGHNGRNNLKYKDFEKFMDDLQTEVFNYFITIVVF
jgi:hypothetical protein